jgi:hypothetical protein
VDELGDDWAHARRLGDLLGRGRAQGAHRAKLLGEATRGDEPDPLQSERGEHDRKRALARRIDRRDQVARRYLAEALELQQLLGC